MNEKKDTYIYLKVSDEEKKQIRQKAKEEHLSMSSYMRKTALEKNTKEKISV